MAEPTTPFTSETLYFIERSAPVADVIAQKLGVSVNALLGAVANEYDTRFNSDLALDLRGGYGQAVSDANASRFDHNAIAADLRGSKLAVRLCPFSISSSIRRQSTSVPAT